jgi:cell wall-associated NlpC family hydrolase
VESAAILIRRQAGGGDNVISRVSNLAMLGGKKPRRTELGLVAGRPIGRRRMLGILAGAAAAGIMGFSNQARAASKGKRIVKEAKKHRRAEYTPGGTNPREGFDCSGFTYFVVKKAIGKDITPALQIQVKEAGRRVGKNRRKRGDLIFFNLEGGRRVTHVAIVLSENRVIHAMNEQDDVKTSVITDPYWKIHSVRRL